MYSLSIGGSKTYRIKVISFLMKFYSYIFYKINHRYLELLNKSQTGKYTKYTFFLQKIK